MAVQFFQETRAFLKHLEGSQKDVEWEGVWQALSTMCIPLQTFQRFLCIFFASLSRKSSGSSMLHFACNFRGFSFEVFRCIFVYGWMQYNDVYGANKWCWVWSNIIRIIIKALKVRNLCTISNKGLGSLKKHSWARQFHEWWNICFSFNMVLGMNLAFTK